MSKEEKLKIVQLAIKDLQKQFGKGVVGFLDDEESYESYNGVLPTGSIALDVALGIMGLPRGRVAEVYGPESSAKTTLALSIIAQTQKNGGIAGFIDAEHALDLDWAKTCGVDTENLLFSQPDYGEQALDVVEGLISTNSVDLIVVDSVSALTPKVVLEKGWDERTIAERARMLTTFFESTIGKIKKSKTAILFINQIRDNINPYGGSEQTPGGRALKFYSTIRMRISKIEEIKPSNSEFKTGIRSRIEVKKNKVAPPFRTAEIEVNFNEGLSLTSELIDLGVAHGIVIRSGSWYSYNGTNIGQGRENAKEFLLENPEMFDEIYDKIRDIYGLRKED